ncbi:unnamed protein product [Miscanthus lutarioriparius]|uniref:Uncharacterized protein n=1 Tax=Miscanthus lutarioriparius TaxID=422564 RepID=A0A811MKZ8_9POAL|nr:unnamed protein product [Miscanthus lutarioriparius]
MSTDAAARRDRTSNPPLAGARWRCSRHRSFPFSRHRVSSPTLLAAGAVPSHLICLFPHSHRHHDELCPSGPNVWPLHRRRRRGAAASLDQESSASETTVAPEEDPGPPVSSDAAADDGVATSAEPADASPEDLENIREIKRVKLTIKIEDPRDIERKRTLGIEDPDEITRDDLAS